MNRTKIDWPNLDYLWNPVTGCPRGCEYCVVRNRVWPRIRHLYGNHDYSKVTFQPKKLFDLGKIKKPSTFFCGFYSDVAFWGYGILVRVLNECALHPEHTIMFLSKEYRAYDGHVWPENTMQGITITGVEDKQVQQVCVAFLNNLPRPFLSLEPLRGTIKTDIIYCDPVIVGTETTWRGRSIPPKPEWIQSVKDHVPVNKIYWKKNIREFL